MHSGKPDGGILVDEKLALLGQLLAEEGLAAAPASRIVARGTSVRLPLSFAQELIWLLDRASPGLTAYNMHIARRVRGPLELEPLRQALNAIVERHAVLRCVFATQDGVSYARAMEGATPPFSLVDLRELPAEHREREAEARIAQQLRTPFDLTRDVLLQATVYRLADQEHLLLLQTHHIAFDGWSRGVLFRELSACYGALARGAAPELPRLELQYADVAAWDRERLQGAELDRLLAYWRRELAGAPESLDLPTDRPRSAATEFSGGQRSLILPAAVTDHLRDVARAHDATLYMLLVAAWQTLLHRYTGQDDIVIGSPTAGRTLEETAPLIGYFNNTMVLRSSFADDPEFGTLLRRVRETVLGAFDHQDVPLEKLEHELRQEEKRSGSGPLYQVVLTMQDTLPASLTLGDLVLEPHAAEQGGAKFDLTMLVTNRPDGLRFALLYRADLFDGATIERLLDHFGTLLAGIAADPSRRVSTLPLVTAAEVAQLDAWNAPARRVAPPGLPSVHAGVEVQAGRVPDRIAVVAGGQELSYAELNRRANRLAHELIARGVGPDVPVGLALDRSADLLVGLLGILKAGGAYVPLSTDLPAERLAAIARECGLGHAVTVQAMRSTLPAGLDYVLLDADASRLAARDSANPADRTSHEHLAYVLFTSGSTGTPKGVAVTHGNLLYYTQSIVASLGLDAPGADGWHFGSVSTLAADLGHTSVFPSLLLGDTLHLLADEVTTSPAAWSSYLERQPLDVLKITPGHLRALAGAEPAAAALPRRLLVLGGEALGWEFADALRRAGTCRVVNHYGPTETTVGVTTFPLDGEDPRDGAPVPLTVPIGTPLPHATLHVLDARGERVPLGVPGELYIGGPSVARGYFGRTELTAERFVSDPFAENAGARLYRSGDRVRRLASGAIEFLGRMDHQVKIRGYRVELGEIETVLRRAPGVSDAAVQLSGPAHAATLVAWVAPGSAADDAALRRHMAALLPDYMVPSTFVRLERMPLTPNGKLDRKALPEPSAGKAPAAAYAEPRDEIERQLCAIFAQVLKRERVGIHDNFLDLGGHSLAAIRVLGNISAATKVRLPLRTIFDGPTVAQLAEAVVRGAAAAGAATGTITPRARRAEALPADQVEGKGVR